MVCNLFIIVVSKLILQHNMYYIIDILMFSMFTSFVSEVKIPSLFYGSTFKIYSILAQRKKNTLLFFIFFHIFSNVASSCLILIFL